VGWQNDPIVSSWGQNDPVIEEPKKREKIGAGEAFRINAGRYFDEAASGLRSAVQDYVPGGGAIARGLDSVDRAMGVASPLPASEYTSGAIDKRLEPVKKDQPVASFAGEFVPSAMSVNPASMAVMAGIKPGSVTDRLMGGGMAYGAGKLGEFALQKATDAIRKYVANRTAKLGESQAANAAKDATVRAAKNAGYVFPPASIAPGPANNLLEGLAGKASVAQGAAMKNEAVTAKLAKSALGLPDDVPLTKETLSEVRSVAGTAYNQLKGFGKITADDDFRASLSGITNEYRALTADFPEMANAKIDGLVKTLSKPEFNSSSAVELVKRLRSDARANFRAFDDPEKQALARVQDGAQKALEDLMERNLVASGNDGFLQVFRNARALIAKTHTVEDALEESTGKVVASKLAKQLGKKPLTGELRTIAETAQAFPKALQNVNTSMPGVSPLDYMGAVLTGGAAGVPAGLAAISARPVVRAGILSGPYQGAMVKAPNYGLGAGDKALKSLSENPELLRRFGGLLGLGGLQAYQ